jgi:hypothetical protein
MATLYVLHVAAFLAKDILKLTNYSSITKRVNCLDNRGRNGLDGAKYNKHGQGEGIANRLKEKGVVGTKTK